MRCDMKAFVEDGKIMISDEQWITIGGEDNDGSGKHVLINGEGTIVAGFGKGKNVKNAFGGSDKGKPKEKISHRTTQKEAETNEFKQFKKDVAENRHVSDPTKSFGKRTGERVAERMKSEASSKGRTIGELIKEVEEERNTKPPKSRTKNYEYSPAVKTGHENAKKISERENRFKNGFNAVKKADTPAKANEIVAKKREGMKISKATPAMKGGKFNKIETSGQQIEAQKKQARKINEAIKKSVNAEGLEAQQRADKNVYKQRDKMIDLQRKQQADTKKREAAKEALSSARSKIRSAREGKADTPEKANEAVAKKKVNISKFNGAPTIEQLKKAEHGGGYSKYQRVHRALGEKEFLSQEGNKPLKNAHFRKTSEENKAFNREYDKESAKAKKKIDSAQAEIDKLNAQYRNSKGTPDSPELERDREQNYRAELKKLVKKRDSARRAWINKEDNLYEKYGQYGGSRYDRQEIEAASRKALKRFRNKTSK